MADSGTKYVEEGKRLQLARKALGLTQAELAERIGSALATVKAYERGISLPNRQFATELARIGINMGYVFSGEGFQLIPTDAVNQHAELVNRIGEADAPNTIAPESPLADIDLNKLRSSSRTIMAICKDLSYQPPMLWLVLVQELMMCQGLSTDGARRIFQTIKEGGI